MAVAQALGSDMGRVIELESIVMLQIPSAVTHRQETERRVNNIPVTSVSHKDTGHSRRGVVSRLRWRIVQ